MEISGNEQNRKVETIAIEEMNTDFQIVFTLKLWTYYHNYNSVGVDNVKLMKGHDCIADLSTPVSEPDFSTEPTSDTTAILYDVTESQKNIDSTTKSKFQEDYSSESDSHDSTGLPKITIELMKSSDSSTISPGTTESIQSSFKLFGTDDLITPPKSPDTSTSTRMNCSNRCGDVAPVGTYIVGCGCSAECVEDNNCCEDYIEECGNDITETNAPGEM